MTDTFIDDLEKVNDLLSLTKEEFLESYSYIDSESYDETLKQVQDVETLADLFRQAENLNIEEMNGRETGLSIKGEDLKVAITNFIDEKDMPTFEEIIVSMGC